MFPVCSGTPPPQPLGPSDTYAPSVVPPIKSTNSVVACMTVPGSTNAAIPATPSSSTPGARTCRPAKVCSCLLCTLVFSALIDYNVILSAGVKPANQATSTMSAPKISPASCPKCGGKKKSDKLSCCVRGSTNAAVPAFPSLSTPVARASRPAKVCSRLP